jgi:peptidoglycan lytic transglycosylase
MDASAGIKLQHHYTRTFDIRHDLATTLVWKTPRDDSAGRGGVIKYVLAAAVLASLNINLTHAAGWSSVHKYVKPTGNCAGGQEVLASYYSIPGKTASGKVFDANDNTAAARSWSLGATLTVTNPHNGRSITVVINDRGPYGTAYRLGARLDLAHGAARRIGMRGAQYVCVS